MSFLQLVLSLDKTKEEIILFWRICQFDRYRNRGASLQGPKVADVTEWSRVSETGKLLCFQCTIMHSTTF